MLYIYKLLCYSNYHSRENINLNTNYIKLFNFIIYIIKYYILKQ